MYDRIYKLFSFIAILNLTLIKINGAYVIDRAREKCFDLIKAALSCPMYMTLYNDDESN